MFKRESLSTFNDATPRSTSNNGKPSRFGRSADDDANSSVSDSSSTIPRAKKPCEKLKFALLNGVVIPPSCLAIIPISGEGIRMLLDVTSTRLYRLPFPMLDRLKMYSGWDQITLADVIAGLLILATSLVWIRVINESKGVGDVLSYRQKLPALFYLYAGVAAGVIGLDALIFLLGIQSRANGWGEVPVYAGPACCVLYVVLCACFAIFHSDYATGKRV
ncbi:hypothetical protein [Rhodopirellula europaea]|uniref:hypothetical protein n=1 Tax=Rhodopirellula europaea TaxID=1263866 RepID=UPI00055CD25F|nr:hypothetical protein [Rhodopirellula europaea]